MAINDNLYLTRGNQKRFAFELIDDEGKQVSDLADVTSIEFVLQDMERTEILRLSGIDIAVNEKYDETKAIAWVTVTISTADAEDLPIGMYRYAIQVRWPDGRVHEWTYSRVLYVLADMIA